jgi:hypothetical protein
LSEQEPNVEDADEPGVVQSRACEQLRMSLFIDGGKLADVGHLVDRKAGAKAAELSDEEALREAVASDPEDGSEIEDGQDLTANVPDAEDGAV